LFQKTEILKRLDFLLAIIFLQSVIYMLVVFDITVARQIIGFLYFTFLPGYLIVKLLKFHFRTLETLIFSVGFSIASLMLVGLFLNELGSMAGILQPLSTIPLLVTLNLLVLVITALTCGRGASFELFDRVSFGLVKWAVPLMLPLVLSIVGAMLVNMYGDNLILLIMILTISSIATVLILKNNFTSKVYAFAVFIIGISLLYHSSLISRYLCSFGSDIAPEFYTSKHTQMNSYWSSTPPAYFSLSIGRLNNMLSITILPTVYCNLLNLDFAWIFKLISPLIFAFVPICLYHLWQEGFGDKYAFISAFFFMATGTFFSELLGLNRQMIGELFFALLLFILLYKNMNYFQRMFSFTIFGFVLVVSHYALAEIFLFLIVFAWVCMFILKRHSNNLTVGMVALFFVIMFAWYIYTSRSSVFTSFLEYADHVIREDKTIIHGEYFTHLFYLKDWIKSFQVIQEDYKKIRIFAILQGDINNTEKRDIENKIKLVMEDDCDIIWEFVDEIPVTSTGKHLYTKSLLYHD